MSNKPISISVGIPALNEEANIARILGDLLSQEKHKSYSLKEIIVYSDGSTDNTNEIVKSIKSSKVKLIVKKTRTGVAKATNSIFSAASGDILFFVNADTRIVDKEFFKKISLPFIEGGVDLVSTSLKELFPKNLVEKVLFAGMYFKNLAFESINNGINLYTCHGPNRVFSKRLYKKIKFEGLVADDMYTYLYAMKHHYTYVYLKEAVVLYKLPSNLSDHFRQSSRFFRSSDSLTPHFGTSFVKSHTNIPSMPLIKSAIRTFIKFPIFFSLYIPLVAVTCLLSLKKTRDTIESQWKIAESSKTLDI